MPARGRAAALLLAALASLPATARQAPPSGPLLTWGVGGSARLGRDGAAETPLQVAHGLEGVAFLSVAAGGHTLAVAADGGVWCWGRNSSDGGGGHGSRPVPDSGQLGHGVPGRPGRVTGGGLGEAGGVSVASGRYHSAAAGADGRAYTWGLNDQGQLGRGGTHAPHADKSPCYSGATCRHGSAAPVPLPLKPGERVVGVAAGRYSTLAWTDRGTLWTWGLDGCARGEPVQPEQQHAPRRVRFPRAAVGAPPLPPRIVSVSAGYVHWLAVSADGRLFSCDSGDDGYAATLPGARRGNAEGELGRAVAGGTEAGGGAAFAPAPVLLGGHRVVAAAAGRSHSLALTQLGEVWSWGSNGAKQLGRPGAAHEPAMVHLPGPASAVAAGEYFSMAALAGGGLQTWGSNGNGQLGRGPAAGKGGLGMEAAILPSPDALVLSLAAGYQHAAAVLAPAAVQQREPLATLLPVVGGAGVPRPAAAPAALAAAARASPRRAEIEAASPDVFAALPAATGYEAGLASPCWRREGQLRCLPLIHILGVSKCGTTDLYKRLAKHPDFVESRNKGPHFWDECELRGSGAAHCAFEGYADLYQPLAEAVERGAAAAVSADASSNTLTASGVWRRGHSPQGNVTVGELLLEAAPYGRFIAILRNPVDRFYSAFHYYRHMFGPRGEPASAQQFHEEAERAIRVWRDCLARKGKRECIRRFEPQQLIKGMYAEFLWDWRRLGAARLLVLRMEDYGADTEGHLASVFDFAGMRQPAEGEWAAILGAPRANARDGARGRRLAGAAEAMREETRALLSAFYAPFNHALAEALGDERFLWS